MPLMLPTGANRADLLVYGSATASERLKRLLRELATIKVDRVRVDAVPNGAPPPDADVVRVQANFTYAIHWRAAHEAAADLTRCARVARMRGGARRAPDSAGASSST